MKEKPEQILTNNNNYDNKIFRFLNPNQNTQLITLSSKDQIELLLLLKKYLLEYRPILNFNQTDTFGLEIEFKKRKLYSHSTENEIYMNFRSLIGNNQWNIDIDGSLLKNGLEASSPILTNTLSTWQELQKICMYLNKIGYIDELCGGHIHIGAQVIGQNFQAWDNFIKLWILYEDIILRFVCGEYLRLRTISSTYAPPISNSMYLSYQHCLKIYHQIDESFLKHFYYLLGNIRQAINFHYIKDFENIKPKNTIEFRCPNGTLNPIIWQNNINLFISILNSVKQNTFNQDLLDLKFKKINPESSISSINYQQINLSAALELSDLIFNNNLDKINFLTQYLKKQQTTKNRYTKSTSFTRKLTKH